MNNRKTVLVCVTPQESSKLLVAAGKVLAEKNAAQLEVISVLPMEFNEERTDPQILDRLYGYAKSEGGEMAVYFSDEPTYTIAAHIAKTKPELLVVGFPGEDSNGFVTMIHLLIPELPISMVDGDKVYNILPFEANQPVCN
ncbi:MAG: hypothetical protein NC122_04620 [Faecalibacterium sp.]|nr:hypothetical protein [Ruminococcus sp.]MCM1391822.1 hypothetical protein [Ruminococcus sp.]MCM1485468.1 hypothetical protein [Faecalibacterium sp.]